jgi:hypothetical protein
LAWPDFSETTYAFALMQELRDRYNAKSFYVDFLTQPAEATSGGYDASVNLDGTLHYFQFKRSEVMKGHLAKELQPGGGFPAAPVFRMHLRSKELFKQHRDLQEFEADNHSVFYAASGAESGSDLRQQFFLKRVINRSGFMVPSEIQLPNFTEEHHVSFKSTLPYFRIYSQVVVLRQRKISDEAAFREWTSARRRNADANRAELEALVEDRQPALFPGQPQSLLVRAALWAQLRYDCQLIFIPAADAQGQTS